MFLGPTDIIVFALIGIVAFNVIGRFSGKGTDRVATLVLREFYVGKAQNGVYINIRGRAPGLLAFIMVILQLDAETTFQVTARSVHFKTASLAGQSHRVVPLPSISSTHCGYSRSIGLLIFGTLAILGGALMQLSMIMLRSTIPLWLIGGIIIGLFCFLQYWLSKRIVVLVETSGGSTIGVSFRRSVIENIPVDMDQALRAINGINRLITIAQNNHGDVDERAA